MESIIYKGIFKHDRVIEDHGVKFWLNTNEKDEDYYTLRNNKGSKIVVLTDPETDVVCGIDKDGAFGFPIPRKVYFVDRVPAHVELGKHMLTITGFKDYIDPLVARHNELLKIDADMLLAFHEGRQVPELAKRKRELMK